jgi:ABC-type dipeptide/oligopeptide/nickel transport system permease component
MLIFCLKRLLFLPLVMFVLTLMIVGFMQLLTPEQRAASFAKTPRQLRNLDKLVEQYGLDKPFHIQYFNWLKEAVRGNLGYSLTSNEPVLETIIERFPATLELTLFASFPIIGFGIWLGTLAALKRNQWVDQVSRVLAVIGYSLPTFVLGIWLLVIFYGGLNVLPGFGRISNEGTLTLITTNMRRYTGLITIDTLLSGQWRLFFDALVHLILPVITLTIVASAQILKTMRSSMLEVLSADYVRTARAKGLSNRVVNLKHARRNALISVATLSGFVVSGLLGGSVITEVIFGYPGIGQWGARTAMQLDYAGTLGFALFSAVLVVVSNLFVDLLYAFLDPRVRYE